MAPRSGGGATQLPGDAVVGGTGYKATGNLGCLIGDRPRQCPFGLIRRGNGTASLSVTLPSGNQRGIEFIRGRPVSSNAQGGIYGEWTGNGSVMVFIGTGERFMVPDAILYGG